MQTIRAFISLLFPQTKSVGELFDWTIFNYKHGL